MLYFGLLIGLMSAQVGATLQGLIPENVFSLMFMSTSLIFSASKVPQIITNFSNKSV
jgi:hypothetical protein